MGRNSTEGIVVKVTEDVIVLLCENGAFKNVSRASQATPPLLGERYIHVEKQTSWLKYMSVAAVFFLAILTYALFPFQKENHAYVIAMDINPSIELVLNEKMKVTETSGYNEEGMELLSALKIEGNSLEIALEKIMAYSFEQGYLSEENRYLETAVVTINEAKESRVVEIEQSILTSSNSLGVEVQLSQNNLATYEEAKNMNVSVNKLVYLKKLEKDGVIDTVEQGKGKTVSELRKMQKPEQKPTIPNQQQGGKKENPPPNSNLDKEKEHPQSNKDKKGSQSNNEKKDPKTNNGKNASVAENKGKSNDAQNNSHLNSNRTQNQGKADQVNKNQGNQGKKVGKNVPKKPVNGPPKKSPGSLR